jgi:hypothetical protein
MICYLYDTNTKQYSAYLDNQPSNIPYGHGNNILEATQSLAKILGRWVKRGDK